MHPEHQEGTRAHPKHTRTRQSTPEHTKARQSTAEHARAHQKARQSHTKAHQKHPRFETRYVHRQDADDSWALYQTPERRLWYSTLVPEAGGYFFVDSPGQWRDLGVEEGTGRRRWRNSATGAFFAV